LLLPLAVKKKKLLLKLQLLKRQLLKLLLLLLKLLQLQKLLLKLLQLQKHQLLKLLQLLLKLSKFKQNRFHTAALLEKAMLPATVGTGCSKTNTI